jgi:glycosyltransferase involved in cell wall biosynthesis
VNILFLDQSGQVGGAELCLLDLAQFYGDRAKIALFEAGPFYHLLRQKNIPAQVLGQSPLAMGKAGGLFQGLKNLDRLVPLIQEVVELSQHYDLIYANTPKALIVGAIASFASRKPLVYHLHDIISADHFSRLNQTLLITLANSCAKLVIANSYAVKDAFIKAGGKSSLAHVVYNGFECDRYYTSPRQAQELRQQLGIDDKFVVGHFSRLSPWKGQHILLEALKDCPDHVVGLFVGDALFGETEYVQGLHQQVERLGLGDRVIFTGFRADIAPLMGACDLVTHTSTAPEPFGRVIVEAMLCKRPVIAAKAGGAVELIQHGRTGWFTPPGNVQELAIALQRCQSAPPQELRAIALRAYAAAAENFQLAQIQQQTDGLLTKLLASGQTLPKKLSPV